MNPLGDIWTCILAQCEGTKPSICHTVSSWHWYIGLRNGEAYRHRIHRRH